MNLSHICIPRDKQTADMLNIHIFKKKKKDWFCYILSMIVCVQYAR